MQTEWQIVKPLIWVYSICPDQYDKECFAYQALFNLIMNSQKKHLQKVTTSTVVHALCDVKQHNSTTQSELK